LPRLKAVWPDKPTFPVTDANVLRQSVYFAYHL